MSKELLQQPPAIKFNGLRLHCVDLFIHELCDVGGKDISHDMFMALVVKKQLAVSSA